jgi:hypothetical protein
MEKVSVSFTNQARVMQTERVRHRSVILAILAAAAILAYLPTLTQPLLEDDYPNITLAAHLGPVSAWKDLFNTGFRLRATSQVLTNAIYSAFDMHAAAYYAAGIVLHVINTWLVYALGAWRRIGYGVSVWAALFFAVAEGHQEAVMWASAANELLQFLFGMTALLTWIVFLQTSRFRWYAVSIAAFALALVSKESAPIFLALMILPLLEHRSKAAWMLPHAALGMVAMWTVVALGSDWFRFRDGSFSIHAPFWITLPRSFFAEFWFWGFAALAVLLRWRKGGGLVWMALAWAAIGLVPYCFLTYSTRIPSRQTYLASVGAALIVGLALAFLAETRRRILGAAVAILMLHNIGYLWTRKRAQFLKRAEPTEQLIALSRAVKGPIYVKCFPRPRLAAEQAVWLVTGRPPSGLIWDAGDAARASATFCYREETK